MRLREGSIVKMRSGNQVRVIRASDRDVELGRDGDGYLYLVEDMTTEKRFALKWCNEHFFDYLPKDDTGRPATIAFHENLCGLCNKGLPNVCFSFPIDVTQTIEGKFYGYTMPLRENRFVGLTSILYSGESFDNLKALCHACENIAYASCILHRHGFSYPGMSLEDIFIDLKTGDISVWCYDNLAYLNDENTTGIKGSYTLMAPELLSRKAKPSLGSDYHQLAVILFYLTMRGHPLEGARWCRFPVVNHEFYDMIYGDGAVFVYDTNDTSNRPLRGIHDNVIALWSFYPEYIRNLFTKAFSHRALTCSADEAALIRVRDWQWKTAFADLRNLVIPCSHCKKQVYLDKDNPQIVCKHCGKQILSAY